MPRRAALLVLLLTAGCGIVNEDGAGLSERSARETLAAARSLERQGDPLRAAEVYEGLALGFPDQHWAPQALAGAARSHETVSRQATGPVGTVEARQAARLWERLVAWYPRSPEAAEARRRAAVLWAFQGECTRALPLLRSLPPGEDGDDGEDLRKARSLCPPGPR